MTTTHEWLATVPEELNLYAVLGSISDAKPVTAYFQATGQINLTALWLETPYANWFQAMPYLVPIDRQSPFLAWVDQTNAKDWGWLAASPYDSEQIRQHLKSLTKATMPDGQEAFFRYWDGRHLYPILNYLNEKQQAGQVIPVFNHYLINQQVLDVELPSKLPEPKAYPWWQVEQALMDKLVEEDSTALIKNLLNALKDSKPSLYFSYPENSLKLKAQHFIENEDYSLDLLAQSFEEYLVQENE